jgi:hypothetical protein
MGNMMFAAGFLLGGVVGVTAMALLHWGEE